MEIATSYRLTSASQPFPVLLTLYRPAITARAAANPVARSMTGIPALVGGVPGFPVMSSRPQYAWSM